MNKDKEILLENLDKIHTTKLGVERIKKNLSLEKEDIIDYCLTKIKNKRSKISKKGKNYYIEIENLIITINSYSYTIITAHKTKK